MGVERVDVGSPVGPGYPRQISHNRKGLLRRLLSLRWEEEEVRRYKVGG